MKASFRSRFLITAALLAAQTLAREQINYNYGWRFHRGDPYAGDADFAPICATNDFPNNVVTGTFCQNLQRILAATSADECKANCCAQLNCSMWFYRDRVTDLLRDTWTSGCHFGQSDQRLCSSAEENWQGQIRPLPADPPIPSSKTNRASRDYDDSTWVNVTLPHDGIIGGEYSINAPNLTAYLPLNTTWYRKKFYLPSDWKGTSVWVYFEGVFKASLVYLNGHLLNYHQSGYTSFSVRLDGAPEVYYGNDTYNVIAVRADAAAGTGWWYEGGGIYRHAYLVSANPRHVVPDSTYGIISPSESISKSRNRGYYAAEAVFRGSVDVVNDASESAELKVRYAVIDGEGRVVGSIDSASFTLASTQTKTVTANLTVQSVELWSPSRPYLYRVSVSILAGSSVVDVVNFTTGARRPRWDPDTGFSINDVRFVWRGFCNHNDFTGVGVGLPDRVNLFRAQMLRAIGGNSWRMAHNPPAPGLLDLLDRLGVLAWDEARDIANDTVLESDMRSMVRRDRNHPSVALWALCNERDCFIPGHDQLADVTAAYKEIIREEDPYGLRNVTANLNVNFTTIGLPLVKALDVQGFSHQSGAFFDSFHEQFPEKPMIASECCSCRTQRAEDKNIPKKKILGSFDVICSRVQTNFSLWRDYMSGTMVWTMFDYYGEPLPYYWPMVSASVGSFDLAGFPKATAFWYRAWWLLNRTSSTHDEDVPVNPAPLLNPETIGPSNSSLEDEYLVYIVQHWEPDDDEPPNKRIIQAYTNAPLAELYINGKSQGIRPVRYMGFAQWNRMQYEKGVIRVVAKTDNTTVVAESSVATSGPPAGIILVVDVPSNDTGTGTALVLDGHDAGLVKAAVVDANKTVVQSASDRVTFRIKSGPGRIIGIGNGDPTCREPNKAAYRDAYHGLARVIVQVNEDWATPAWHRRRLLEIDVEGRSSVRVANPDFDGATPPPKEIVVEAMYGKFVGQVAIPLTTDAEKYGVLAVAESWMAAAK